MNYFLCPVCGKQLQKYDKYSSCSNNHCFDFSKSGYLNLLMSQQTKEKRHGDDKKMVHARQVFLEKGFYLPLLNAVTDCLSKNIKANSVILDAGCGECWYTSKITERLSSINPHFFGIDISKNALELSKKRGSGIDRAVASVYKIPLADSSCDAIIDIFAPIADDEFSRIAKPDGILILAVPLENHLYSLKQAVYESPYKNPPVDIAVNGFTQVDLIEIKNEITLSSNEDILNLFMMTPYYYKTSKTDFEKLNKIEKLKVQTEFAVIVYKKS